MKIPVAIAILIALFETRAASYDDIYHRNSPCHAHCSSAMLHVCGSDGEEYVNECVLNKAICNDKSGELKKLHDGLCKGTHGVLRGIIFDPICATDGKTYSNVVFKDVARCLTRKPIGRICNGFCSGGRSYNLTVPKCKIGCPKVYNPVCGDDGATYLNECTLDVQNCIFGGELLKKLHNGVCKKVYEVGIIGIENYSPVCGSDGNTYSSKSFVDVARCQNKHLRIMKYEACN